MLGAIAGDIIGSVHEGTTRQRKDFPLFVSASTFTDDTVLTVAIGHAVRQGTDYQTALQHWGRRYPNAGYGGWFAGWLTQQSPAPYNSFGNGSAMRVSAIGWAFEELESVLQEARHSAEVTHDHPEGIKGAQAIAAAVHHARLGATKSEIADLLQDRFGYDCTSGLEHWRARGGFDVTCQGTVPAAAAAFLESHDFEDAIRNAVSLGGDADTLACIAGAMAEAHYGSVPDAIQREVMERLDAPLRAEVIDFARTYGTPLTTE